MNEHDPARGLRPMVAAACRSTLPSWIDGLADREANASAAEHMASCAACRRHVRAADVLAGALRQRPAVPAELASHAFLEGVFERAVAMFEDEGSLVAELARPSAPPFDADSLPGSEGLLESSVGVLVGAAPPQPSAWDWERVRRSVRAETLRASPRVLRSRRILVATIAASLAVGAFLVANRPIDRGPEIRFVDLASAPAVEFTVLRHGLDH